MCKIKKGRQFQSLGVQEWSGLSESKLISYRVSIILLRKYMMQNHPNKLDSLGPLNGLVSKSAKFSSVFTYAVRQSSLATPSRTKWYARTYCFFFNHCRFNRRFTEPKIIDHANILDQLLLHIGAQSKGSAARTNRSKQLDSHDQSLAQRALNYRSIDITMHTHTLTLE